MKKESKLEKGLRKEWKNIIFNFLFVIISILVLVLFYKKIMITTLLLIAIAVIGLIKWKSKLTIIIFIFCGILFRMAEMIIINYNLWSYSVSSFKNIPLWLFILWGDAAAFIYQMAVEIKKLGVKDK